MCIIDFKAAKEQEKASLVCQNPFEPYLSTPISRHQRRKGKYSIKKGVVTDSFFSRTNNSLKQFELTLRSHLKLQAKHHHSSAALELCLQDQASLPLVSSD